MITSKSRRKGYSYKMAAVASNRYDTVPDAIVLLMAYEKKYLYGRNGIFDMAKKNADFLNEHTAWTKKREKIDTKDSIKASYIEIDRNTKVPLEKGYCSQITSVSFHDDPDGSRGVDFDLGIVDEGGKFPNWQDSYHAMLPSQEAGMYKTGFLIVFGTGGDMDGGTVDFSDHFYNAETFGYNCYKNTWDEGSVKDGGYFHPQYIGEQGFIDAQGNSKVKEAKEYERALVHLSEMTLQLEQAVRDEEEGKESPATAHFIFGQPAIERVLSLAVNEQIKRNPLVIKVPQPFGVSLLALLGIWTTQGEQILGKISQYVDFQGFVNDGLTMISSAPVDLSMQGSATVLVSSYAVAATVHFFYKFFRKKPGAKGDKSDVVQNQENITDRNHSFEISRHTSLTAITTDTAQSIPGLDLWTVTSSDPLSPKAEPEQLDIVLFSKEGQPALIVIRK
jgi:hypothetical protein